MTLLTSIGMKCELQFAAQRLPTVTVLNTNHFYTYSITFRDKMTFALCKTVS